MVWNLGCGLEFVGFWLSVGVVVVSLGSGAYRGRIGGFMGWYEKSLNLSIVVESFGRYG